METSSTKQDTVTKTTPLALNAVARHMLDHELRVDSIQAPLVSRGERSVIVHVPNDDGAGYWSARWQDTIAVDGQGTAPIGGVPDAVGIYERHVVHGRLPDSGVRVSVVTIRRVASSVVGRRLASVPGGAA